MFGRPPLLIYLHGFNSSPASHKAELLRNYMGERGLVNQYLVPELDAMPKRAVLSMQRLIEAQQNSFDITLLGSSLGGYYATHLAQCFSLKAVLINPAVNPADDLKKYLGRTQNLYTKREYDFTSEHLRQLLNYQVREILGAERFLVFLQTGDEVLDYRDAADRYRRCELRIEEGGSHGYTNFERAIPSILAFAGFNDSIENERVRL